MNNDRIDIKEKINLISLEISHSDLIDYVIVYETNGKLLDIFIAKDHKLPFSSPDSLSSNIREKLKKNSIWIDTPKQLFDSDTYYSSIIIPWMNKGELIGYLATYYDLSVLTHIVQQTSEVRFNDNNHIYILNCFGKSIIGLEKDDNYFDNMSIQLFESTFCDFLKSVNTSIAVTNTYKNEDVQMLTSYKTLPDFKIVIGVEQKYKTAFKTITKLQRITLIIAVLSIIIALLVSLLFSRYIAIPLNKLNHLINRLTKEKTFGQTVDIDSNDEISDLADSFNHLSIELDQYSNIIQRDAIIKGNLARFLSPHLVERIITHEDNMPCPNEEREIAIIFADIHDFSFLTEKLHASEVMMILNTYFTRCGEIIFNHNGTVDKYIGDCIMALFNAPYDIDEPAIVATRAAIEICNIMSEISNEYKDSLQKAGLVKFSVGIGISYGKAIVGNLGSDDRMDYTAVGDIVNIASHIQGLAKGKNEILVDKNVYESINYSITCEFYQRIKLKGRSLDSEIYRII